MCTSLEFRVDDKGRGSVRGRGRGFWVIPGPWCLISSAAKKAIRKCKLGRGWIRFVFSDHSKEWMGDGRGWMRGS